MILGSGVRRRRFWPDAENNGSWHLAPLPESIHPEVVKDPVHGNEPKRPTNGLSRQKAIEGISMHVGQFSRSEDRLRVDGKRLKIEERGLFGNPVAWWFR